MVTWPVTVSPDMRRRRRDAESRCGTIRCDTMRYCTICSAMPRQSPGCDCVLPVALYLVHCRVACCYSTRTLQMAISSDAQDTGTYAACRYGTPRTRLQRSASLQVLAELGSAATCRAPLGQSQHQTRVSQSHISASFQSGHGRPRARHRRALLESWLGLPAAWWLGFKFPPPPLSRLRLSQKSESRVANGRGTRTTVACHHKVFFPFQFSPGEPSPRRHAACDSTPGSASRRSAHSVFGPQPRLMRRLMRRLSHHLSLSM